MRSVPLSSSAAQVASLGTATDEKLNEESDEKLKKQYALNNRGE